MKKKRFVCYKITFHEHEFRKVCFRKFPNYIFLSVMTTLQFWILLITKKFTWYTPPDTMTTNSCLPLKKVKGYSFYKNNRIWNSKVQYVPWWFLSYLCTIDRGLENQWIYWLKYSEFVTNIQTGIEKK